MPELPEVETVKKGLIPAMEGQKVIRMILNRADLRFPFPVGFGQAINGATLIKLGRRGKYLTFDTSRGDCLISHLGMSGSFRVETQPHDRAHDHVRFVMGNGQTVTYNDPRRFGFMDLVAQGRVYKPFEVMGPEPLGDGFNGSVLASALKGRGVSIKTALLDQSVVAGVGNIYACEALCLSGISPRRKASSVQGVRAQRLAEAIQTVLSDAIAAGGSSLQDHRQTNGDMGYFQHNFTVYDRAGQPCQVCQTDGEFPISQITQSGRSTFFCPRHQR